MDEQLPAAIPAVTLIAIAVVEHDGAYLVGTRAEGVPLPGLAEFPGGKVEKGETPADAAVRECLEETALAVRVVGSYPSVLHHYEHGIVDLRFFACQPLSAAQIPRPPFRWVPRSQLHKLEFPAANAVLTEYLIGGGSPCSASI